MILEEFMKATDYFLNGNSCSESVVLAAADDGFCDKGLLSVASPFSGGLGSGCLCGAISGAMIVIGNLYGKNNKYNNPPIAREIAKQFMERFKEVHKVTCCRILSKGFEFHTPERKQHCANFVDFSYKCLTDLLKETAKNG